MIFSEKQKNLLFWVIGLSVSAFFVVFVFGVYYQKWQGQKRVEELKTALENWEREIFNKKAADKIGGKTPQETMNLYIEAVEKGDYELASKYFVIEKQEEELRILKNSPQKNIENIIKLMKDTKNEFTRFSGEEKSFSVHNPILVSFILYPSGNWKIEEI